MIRVVHPGSGFFTHPGSLGQKGTGSRIRNTVKQYGTVEHFSNQLSADFGNKPLFDGLHRDYLLTKDSFHGTVIIHERRTSEFLNLSTYRYRMVLIRFRIWIRNRNQNRNFFKVGTGTGTPISHYSSTTLLIQYTQKRLLHSFPCKKIFLLY
jgi:hypothetical protein